MIKKNKSSVEQFLELYIPEGTTEYAPEGIDDIQCNAVIVDHFQAIAAEEAFLLEKMANTRFIG